MTSKDQLEQSGEGKEVVALLAKHFPPEQFQAALTLIEQRYTEDQTVWDADLNRDSQWPFLKISQARRLLVFFASPTNVAKIKAELKQRAAETALRQPVVSAERIPAAAKPKAKRKTISKASAAVHKARSRKRAAAKTVKQKPRRPQRSQPPMKRRKPKNRQAKARKSGTKKH